MAEVERQLYQAQSTDVAAPGGAIGAALLKSMRTRTARAPASGQCSGRSTQIRPATSSEACSIEGDEVPRSKQPYPGGESRAEHKDWRIEPGLKQAEPGEDDGVDRIQGQSDE